MDKLSAWASFVMVVVLSACVTQSAARSTEALIPAAIATSVAPIELIPTMDLATPLATLTSARTPSPTSTATPKAVIRDCPPIQDSFILEYVPDINRQLYDELIDFLNGGILSTPITTAETGSDTIHIEVTVRLRQDVTNDSVAEIFLTAANIPKADTDLVGVWIDHLILACNGGRYQRIYASSYQNLYTQYQVEVLSDTNGNSVPEVRITETNTHWEISVTQLVLEWDGIELRPLTVSQFTPTPPAG